MIQLKRGLQSSLSNVILEPGQPGWAEDVHILKIGDGSTSFSNLTGLSALPTYIHSTNIDGSEIDNFYIKFGTSDSVFNGKLYMHDDTIESLAYLDSVSSIHLKGSPIYVGLPDDGITASIKNVSNPIDNTDAANKQYVDSRTTEHVVESGTIGIWNYRKWSSGRCELWGIYVTPDNVSVTNSQGTSYYSDPINIGSYPFELTNEPILVIVPSFNGSIWYSSYDNTIDNTTLQVRVNATQRLDRIFTIGFYVIAKYIQ